MERTNKKHPLVNRILFDHATIVKGIKKIAESLNEEYQDKKDPIVFVGILKGCLPFMMELIKSITFDIKIDFIVVSSYFGGIEKTTQKPRLIMDADLDLNGHHVVVIEDVIETSNTIQMAKKHLKMRGAKTIKVAGLILKQENDIINLEITPDWYALKAPMCFLVGFGLDFQEKLRNLDYIGELKI